MRRTGLQNYGPVFIGLVMILGGVAAAGCFLAAAGGGSTAGAVVLGFVAALLLSAGFGLVIAGAKTRGGMLSAVPTPSERRHYRDVYRRRR